VFSALFHIPCTFIKLGFVVVKGTRFVGKYLKDNLFFNVMELFRRFLCTFICRTMVKSSASAFSTFVNDLRAAVKCSEYILPNENKIFHAIKSLIDFLSYNPVLILYEVGCAFKFTKFSTGKHRIIAF
jgi:hypothetical protein